MPKKVTLPSKKARRKEELKKCTNVKIKKKSNAKIYEKEGDKTGQNQKPKKKANPSAKDIIKGKAKFPTKETGFDEWFNDLTVEEINRLAKYKKLRKKIKDNLRAGNNHEWFKVSQFKKAKEWGVTSQEIKYLAVTPINRDEDDDLWFVDIEVPKNKQKGKLKGKESIDGRHTDGKKKGESTHGVYEGPAAYYA
ncbi:MAG: hypothetical protein K2M60_01865, partial [Lachnospiraceae bacterium]|nr:hypothetical protein [Lachnospiraceae bacterium]